MIFWEGKKKMMKDFKEEWERRKRQDGVMGTGSRRKEGKGEKNIRRKELESKEEVKGQDCWRADKSCPLLCRSPLPSWRRKTENKSRMKKKMTVSWLCRTVIDRLSGSKSFLGCVKERERELYDRMSVTSRPALFSMPSVLPLCVCQPNPRHLFYWPDELTA